MGARKGRYTGHLNKKNYYLIKMYSRYHKDIWGFLRLKRLYKYKRVIYSILKHKRKFYYYMLYVIHHGIKFFLKTYKYRTQLFLIKKQLKLFYGFLRNSYLAKLGTLVKGKLINIITYFFIILECRLDVLLYRSLYANTIYKSYLLVLKKIVVVNKYLIFKPNHIIYISDIVLINALPVNWSIFYQYIYTQKKDLSILTRQYFLPIMLIRGLYNIQDFIKNRLFFLYYFLKKQRSITLKMVKKSIHKHRYLKAIHIKYTLFQDIYLFFYKFLKLLYIYIYIKKKRKYIVYWDLTWERFKKHLSREIIDIRSNVSMFRILRKKYRFKVKKKIFLTKGFLRFFLSLVILLTHYDSHVWVFYKLMKKNMIIRLYGYINFKLRFRLFYKYLQVKLDKKRLYLKKDYNYRHQIKHLYWANQVIFEKRNYRFWKLSKKEFCFLNGFENIYYIYKGVPFYIELNYKIHMFILVRNPTRFSIVYPFGVDSIALFTYLMFRGYF